LTFYEFINLNLIVFVDLGFATLLGVKGGKRCKSLTWKSSSQAFYLLPQDIDFLNRIKWSLA